MVYRIAYAARRGYVYYIGKNKTVIFSPECIL